MNGTQWKNQLEETIKSMLSYHPDADTSLIRNAGTLAEVLHMGQNRLDGSSWLEHIAAVVDGLVQLQVDDVTIAAAYLHDSIRDTDVTLADLVDEVPDSVLQVIKDVTSIKEVRIKSSNEGYYENIRNLFLTSTNDVRAILIRLVEQNHNIQTSHVFPAERQQKKAEAILTVYSPLTDLLNIQKLKRQLEDNAFAILHPEEYNTIRTYYSDYFSEQEHFVDKIVKNLSELTGEHAIKIFGRQKHPYSTYKKYLHQKAPYEDLSSYLDRLHDKLAFTILTNTEESCYHVLSLLHSAYSYNSSEFDDYINNPKPNGYRSIHTVVYIVDDVPSEVQIKTEQMHEYNEFGPASHYNYKLLGRDKGVEQKTPDEKIAYLKTFMNWRDTLLQKDETLALNSKHIYVFTPKADVVELPVGSTPIDFAYRIHSSIGNSMHAARVNNKLVSLDTELKSTDICEIITDKSRKKPSQDWLRIAKTSYARAYIRKALKH